MSRSSWIEIVCDGCGCADFYPTGTTDWVMREKGWIISAKRKHFCDSDCRTVYLKKQAT